MMSDLEDRVREQIERDDLTTGWASAAGLWRVDFFDGPMFFDSTRQVADYYGIL